MARILVCSNCNKEFEYNKRGPKPKVPLCPNCSTVKEKESASNTQHTDNANKVPPATPQKKSKKQEEGKHYEYYYEFVGPSEAKKPFEEGEKLYVIPGIYYSEKRIHTRGRVVEFVKYDENNPDLVYVKAHFKRLGKKNEEVVTTKKSRLRRFKKVKVPVEPDPIASLDYEGEV